MKQPGPAEALKQMLFRLQAVEAELQRQQQASPAPVCADTLQAEKTPVKQVRTVTLQVRKETRKCMFVFEMKQIQNQNFHPFIIYTVSVEQR